MQTVLLPGCRPPPPGCRPTWLQNPWHTPSPGCRSPFVSRVLPTRGQTNTCENITLLKVCLREVNMKLKLGSQTAKNYLLSSTTKLVICIFLFTKSRNWYPTFTVLWKMSQKSIVTRVKMWSKLDQVANLRCLNVSRILMWVSRVRLIFTTNKQSSKGNVFSLMCLSVHKWGGVVSPCTRPWHPYPPDMFKLIHYVGRIVLSAIGQLAFNWNAFLSLDDFYCPQRSCCR